MRIGVDFDDTLADFSTLLVRSVRERFGLDLLALHAEGKPGRQAAGDAAWDALIEEMLTTDMTLEMAPKADCIDVTQRLAERHELVILTARRDSEIASMRRWLNRHGIPVADTVHTNRQTKAPHARDLGLAVHIDDTPKVFDDFVGHETVAALYLGGSVGLNRPQPGAHVRTLSHWREFEALVGTLERG